MPQLTKWSIISVLFLVLVSCRKDETIEPVNPEPEEEEKTICETIPGADCLDPNPQRTGDPTAGYDYLVNGDYIRSGIPYGLFTSYYGSDPTNHLGRTGDNATINYQYTAVDAPNGVRVVAPNCLQCHAQTINGEFIVGLGNTTYDFTIDQGANAGTLRLAIAFAFGPESPEMNASDNFLTAIETVGPHLLTEVKGANPADKLATILAAHRNPDDLTWQSDPSVEISDQVIPSDVPAWWLLKKKYAMFYTGVGRQDFVQFMMASSLLTVDNSSDAEEIEEAFVDVLAYIETLEAPAYPNAIDHDKAENGRIVFENNCASCHGTYGVMETYPNVLIPVSYLGTDPYLAQSNYDQSYFLDWFNGSWFGSGTHAGKLQASDAYIAPPLDGIWATAPYLHNGSVPTLEDLLNSLQRPTYWRRSFSTDDYNFDKVGWNYSVEGAAADNETYNTTLPGYGNTGHTFGDILSDEERADLIEYLKTL